MMSECLPDCRFSRRQFSRFALGATAAGLGCVACGGTLPAAVPAATVASFVGQPDVPLLVDPDWLKVELQNRERQILILDLSTLPRYRKGHVVGAVHAWWHDTIELNDDVYGTLLLPDNTTDQTDRIRVLEDMGIDDEVHVVCYDDDRGRWAARLVWFLRFLGHDRASALDGGLAAWRASGGETIDEETAPPDNPPPTVTPRNGYYIGTDSGEDNLLLRLADPRTLLVDVRTEEEWLDDVNESLPIGRIPGAVSLPWTETLRDEAGRLKSPEELTALLTGAGVTPDRRIVLYARYGVETAQSWLVLTLMGYPDVVIYDRGWAGWATTPGLEIAPL